MAEQINYEALLRETVNPVFKTAQSCVQLLAAVGDADAARMLDALGFPSFADQAKKANLPPEVRERVAAIFPAFMTLSPSRYYATNRLIAALGAQRILDLPCGYTPRGVQMTAEGKTYFGFDLPAVIDAVGPAARNLTEEAARERLHYHAVDATSFQTLNDALSKPDGELLITTEGLLMYFTQSELEEVFSNVRRILQLHGGRWITADRDLSLREIDIMTAVLGGGADTEKLVRGLTSKLAGDTADVELRGNVFFDPDEAKAEQFVRDMGFRLRRLPMADYLPENLCAMARLPEERMPAIRKVYETTYFWELTAAETAETTFSREEKEFSVHAELKNGTLAISLSGRLDTLTAPKLLELYHEAVRYGMVDGIEIDLRELDYISSAGLRVLMMMYKPLRESGRFRLVNVGKTVSEILKTTGLDKVLC